MKTIFIIAVVMIGASAMQLWAQKFERSVVASAGTYSSTNYKLSSTLGEAAVMSLSGGNYRLSQGFQQASISVTTATETEELAAMKVSIFPNPTAEYLNISIAENTSSLSLSITDLLGNTLCTIKNCSSNERIDMNAYASGQYMLYLRNGNGGIIGTYTIMKVR